MLLRGTAIVSALTLLSRVLGFVRDLLVARLLGASLFADAFFVAFRIPNLLRSFVAEGALTSAFVPVFASSLAESKESAQITLRRVSGFLLCLTIPLTLLGILFAPSVISVFAPGFSEHNDKFALCVTLTRYMMPYIICVSFIAMLNSALNACNIFGTSALAQVIMNLVLIVGALAASPFLPDTATQILSVSVIIGGIVQLFAQAPACRRAGLSWMPSFNFFSKDVGQVVALMLPATVGASIYQLTIFFGTFFASFLREGSVSWLFYADRVAQFPIGIFSVALASVLLPALSNASASSDGNRFRTNLGDSLRYTSFMIIPMAVGIFCLSLPIVRLLFERGQFSSDSSIMTSNALKGLAVGLWATSCHSMIVRAFLARKDTVTPTMTGLCTLMVNVLCSLLLMGPIIHTPDSPLTNLLVHSQALLLEGIPFHWALGHVGIALASSVSSLVSLSLLILLFRWKIGDFPWNIVIPATVQSTIAAAITALPLLWIASSIRNPVMACLWGALIGPTIYFAAAWLLGSREARETVLVLRKFVRR